MKHDDVLLYKSFASAYYLAYQTHCENCQIMLLRDVFRFSSQSNIQDKTFGENSKRMKALTISAESFILDVSQAAEYVSALFQEILVPAQGVRTCSNLMTRHWVNALGCNALGCFSSDLILVLAQLFANWNNVYLKNRMIIQINSL